MHQGEVYWPALRGNGIGAGWTSPCRYRPARPIQPQRDPDNRCGLPTSNLRLATMPGNVACEKEKRPLRPRSPGLVRCRLCPNLGPRPESAPTRNGHRLRMRERVCRCRSGRSNGRHVSDAVPTRRAAGTGARHKRAGRWLAQRCHGYALRGEGRSCCVPPTPDTLTRASPRSRPGPGPCPPSDAGGERTKTVRSEQAQCRRSKLDLPR